MARWMHLELLSVVSILEGKKRKGKKMVFVVNFSTHKDLTGKEAACDVGGRLQWVKTSWTITTTPSRGCGSGTAPEPGEEGKAGTTT